MTVGVEVNEGSERVELHATEGGEHFTMIQLSHGEAEQLAKELTKAATQLKGKIRLKRAAEQMGRMRPVSDPLCDPCNP